MFFSCVGLKQKISWQPWTGCRCKHWHVVCSVQTFRRKGNTFIIHHYNHEKVLHQFLHWLAKLFSPEICYVPVRLVVTIIWPREFWKPAEFSAPHKYWPWKSASKLLIVRTDWMVSFSSLIWPTETRLSVVCPARTAVGMLGTHQKVFNGERLTPTKLQDKVATSSRGTSTLELGAVSVNFALPTGNTRERRCHNKGGTFIKIKCPEIRRRHTFTCENDIL